MNVFSLALEARWGGRTVEVVVVLYLVPEEGTRDVDLLTSDNGDLLASEDLVMGKKMSAPVCRVPSPGTVLATYSQKFPLHSAPITTTPPVRCKTATHFSQKIFSETLTCLATTEASRPRR